MHPPMCERGDAAHVLLPDVAMPRDDVYTARAVGEHAVHGGKGAVGT
jgi:hypothetical protein